LDQDPIVAYLAKHSTHKLVELEKQSLSTDPTARERCKRALGIGAWPLLSLKKE
jgi:hypothetical protein